MLSLVFAIVSLSGLIRDAIAGFCDSITFGATPGLIRDAIAGFGDSITFGATP